jgi:hypothetical protein
MEAAAKTLTEAAHKLAEHMYAQQPGSGPQGQGGAPGGAAGGTRGGQGDEVIDAEYVDVDKK